MIHTNKRQYLKWFQGTHNTTGWDIHKDCFTTFASTAAKALSSNKILKDMLP